MQKSPDAFRTISEVAEALETPTHVLRFWESRFPQVRPVKRAGGRRYYRPSDVALLAGIKQLLHDDGMTIRGVQKLLRERGVRHVAGLAGGTEEDDDTVLDLTPEPDAAPEAGAGDVAPVQKVFPFPPPLRSGPRAGAEVAGGESEAVSAEAEVPAPGPEASEPEALEEAPESEVAETETPAPESAPDFGRVREESGAALPEASTPEADRPGTDTPRADTGTPPAKWYLAHPLPGPEPPASALAETEPADSPEPPRCAPEPTLPPTAWPENMVTGPGLAAAPPPRPPMPDPAEIAPEPVTGPTFAARLRAAPPAAETGALRPVHDRLAALRARMAEAARHRGT